jgi:hypothetical protein
VAAIGLGAVVLALLAVVPYLSALGHPLLHDDRTLLDNRWLFDEADAPGLLTHDYWFGTRHAGSDLYRPVTVATLAWNLRSASGSRPFRVTNLALHAMVAILVWATLARTLNRLSVPTAEAVKGPAWIGAALFAVHPLGSEAVLLAVGRAELLAALFALAAFLLASSETRGGRGVLDTVASAALLLVALGSKESAAAWIPIFLGWWIVSRLAGRATGREPMVLGTWAATLGIFLIVRAGAVGFLPGDPPWVDNPLVMWDPVTRLANALRLQALYLFKMVAPFRLSVDYGYDQISVWPALPWGIPAAVAVASGWSGVAWALRRLSPAALFLWILPPLAFAVTGNFFFPIGTIFAERITYVPLIGLCGLIGYLAWRLSPGRATTVALVVAWVAATGARTTLRTRDFSSYVTFVEATAAASPRSVKALANAGRTRFRTGKTAEALEPLERALEIWPDYPRALAVLSEVHEALGNTEDAEEYRQRSRQAHDRGPDSRPRGSDFR